MPWQIFQLEKSLGAHVDEWDALNKRLANSHPMLAGAFVNSLLTHFGDGSEHLCVLEERGEALAMCIVKRKNAFVWTTFLPSQAQVGPLLLGDKGCVADLMRHLGPGVVGLDLLCVDPQLATFGPPIECRATAALQATTMNVTLSGGYEAYWAGRPSGLRQNLRRYEKRATSDGLAPRLVTHTSTIEMPEAVRRYAGLESKGWKGTLGTALAPDNVQGHFYAQVLGNLATCRLAEVHELWMGDRLAASRLVIVGGNMLVMLKTTYDEELDAYAPGRILLRLTLEYMFRHHAGRVIEFYTDATQDQLAWATATRQIKHWTIYRAPGIRFAVHTLRWLKGMTKTNTPLNASSTDERLSVQTFTQFELLPKEVLQFLNSTGKSDFRLSATGCAILVSVLGAKSIQWVALMDRKVCVAVLVKVQRDRPTSLWARASPPIIFSILDVKLKADGLLNIAYHLKRTHSSTGSFKLALLPHSSICLEEIIAAFEAAGMPTAESRFSGHRVGKDLRKEYGRMILRSRSPLPALCHRWNARLSLIGLNIRTAHGQKEINALVESLRQTVGDQEVFADLSSKDCLQAGIADEQLQLGVMLRKGKPIAAQWWAVHDDCAWLINKCFDDPQMRLRPNRLLARICQDEMRGTDTLTSVADISGAALTAHDHGVKHSVVLEAFQVHTLRGASRGLVSWLGSLTQRIQWAPMGIHSRS